MLNKNKVGLALGSFSALIHALWSLAIAISRDQVQKGVDLIVRLHSLNLPVRLIDATWKHSIGLVVINFIMVFVAGWIFAAIYNRVSAK